MEGKQDKTGTLYRRNRSYDPLAGRFTQEDPIGLAGGVNLYGFANGDPVNFSDPFGLNPLCPTCRLVFAGARGGAILGGSTLGVPGALIGAVLGGASAGLLAHLLFNEASAPDLEGALGEVIGDGQVSEGRRVKNVDRRGGDTSADQAFDRLADRLGAEPKDRPGEIRVVPIPGGGTASVRPTSKSTGGPTIQIDRPGDKTIKIRFPNE